jgi:hypothetical protein
MRTVLGVGDAAPSVAFGASSPQGGERLRLVRRRLALLNRPPPCGGQIREADQGVGPGLVHLPNS